MIRQKIYHGLNRIAARLYGSPVKKYLPVLLWRQMMVIIRPQSLVIFGRRIFTDTKDSLALTEGYEQDEVALIRKVVKKGDVVVDIGANIGFYTLLFSDLVGPGGKVFAFEPLAANFELLKKNIAINHCDNVVAVNKAVSGTTGKLTFFVSGNTMDYRIYDAGKGGQTLQVECVSLDDYFSGRPVDFIKMDVEGAEPSLLKGMVKTIKQNRHMKLLSEFWPAGLEKFGTLAQEYAAQLASHGFVIHTIEKKGKLTRVGKKELQVLAQDLFLKEAPDHESFTNLFCVK